MSDFFFGIFWHIKKKLKMFYHSGCICTHEPKRHVLAPTLICFLSLWSIPCNQLPKVFITVQGGYKFDAIWMANYIERAKRHWKNKCVIVWSWWLHVLTKNLYNMVPHNECNSFYPSKTVQNFEKSKKEYFRKTKE